METILIIILNAGKRENRKKTKNSEEVTNSGRYNYSADRNVLLGFALKGSIKHFKGEGPCCGGGSGSSKKAKTKFLDGPVIGRKTLKISGMHCEHCANTVTNALNGLDGVTAKVSLKENSAEVSYDREIDLADLKNAVKNAGYEVTSIS